MPRWVAMQLAEAGCPLARERSGAELPAIDEVGYLNYDNRCADLLFEVVTRRYLTVPVLLSPTRA